MSIFTKMIQARLEKRAAERAAARADFWDWFRSNTGFLQGYLENVVEVIGEVGRRLDAVDPRLAFEMGRADDGVYEFIVSADGLSDLFPEVRAMTDAAPEIPGWRVIAFRPRKQDPAGSAVGFKGVDVLAKALWYRSSPTEDRIDITLSVTGQPKQAAERLIGHIFLLLDATLGEYDVATRIGVIEFDDCPPDPASYGLKRLPELAREVDERFNKAA